MKLKKNVMSNKMSKKKKEITNEIKSLIEKLNAKHRLELKEFNAKQLELEKSKLEAERQNMNVG